MVPVHVQGSGLKLIGHSSFLLGGSNMDALAMTRRREGWHL